MRKKSYAKKSFGQNFLIDSNYVNRIINALDPKGGETIVEIGAGRGALTENLLESGANVIAIELDGDLVPALHRQFSDRENFILLEIDALDADFAEILAGKKGKLVANLPYNISTAILQKLIAQRDSFSEMLLMFQREVAERITAQPGNSARGFLSVLVEGYLETEKLFDVPPRAFRPVPKVWSSMMRFVPKAEVEKDDVLFRNLLSAAFAQPRKTILNNLKNAPNTLQIGDAAALLENCEIDPKRRAETLTLVEWERMVGDIQTKKAEN